MHPLNNQPAMRTPNMLGATSVPACQVMDRGLARGKRGTGPWVSCGQGEGSQSRTARVRRGCMLVWRPIRKKKSWSTEWGIQRIWQKGRKDGNSGAVWTSIVKPTTNLADKKSKQTPAKQGQYSQRSKAEQASLGTLYAALMMLRASLKSTHRSCSKGPSAGVYKPVITGAAQSKDRLT